MLSALYHMLYILYYLLYLGQFFAIKSKKNIVFLINLKAKKVFPQGFEWI